jgi:redox-sensitive bicupin YhaK (pirin superfamily)
MHHTDIPVIDLPGGHAAVIMGEVANLRSPAKAFSPLVASELVIHKNGDLELPLAATFEHIFVVLDGEVACEGQLLSHDTLYYLGTHHDGVSLSSREGARVMVLGGTPFSEPIMMWWNFVARTIEELEQARDDWEQHRRFGDVAAYRGARLKAPPLNKIQV